MKKTTIWTVGRQVTRREFVGRAIATGVVFSQAPAFLRGQNLNSKLDIAVIGAGGRGRASLNELTIDPANPPKRTDGSGPLDRHPDENIVALCDINQESVDAAGVRYPKAAKFVDLRKVFDKPDAFDSVVVATAEHTHVFATYLALTHGKHVYCEKPLAYNIWETRLVRETARKHPKLMTQMGNQGHASPMRRTIREILDTGVIGKVKEVHVWADRAWGLQDAASAEKYDKPHGFYNGIQIVDRFREPMEVPASLHFDLWLGPAPERPYHATYFPGPRWYRWWDFGNGTMSDLGSHDNDVPYTVLEYLWKEDAKAGRYLAPKSVHAESPNVPRPHPELAPATLKATYEYVGANGEPLTLVWYQGDVKPDGWTEAWGKRSCIFIGDKGKLLGNGKLLVDGNVVDHPAPPERLPRSPGHWVEWVDAIRGKGPVPGSNFQYAAWTTEANHLGNVAYRTGKKIEWDWRTMRATNAPEAAPYIRRPSYRKGWDDILKTT
ncbi:oxidoreductase [Luteitalea sp. TBR-22]|uniref:Gfo/Idh/MocA family protein n=1 Tax=Luteitalea sp. TBR-22 TaxID=2802971 RepID=UPI001AF9C18C|nr:Gfo/Idh/MocA family oxidoreductase [Luteitalea sp. TBR-22]BCS32463.1 oxidoreductase [Luteitalea sp. TBR-22]